VPCLGGLPVEQDPAIGMDDHGHGVEHVELQESLRDHGDGIKDRGYVEPSKEDELQDEAHVVIKGVQ